MSNWQDSWAEIMPWHCLNEYLPHTVIGEMQDLSSITVALAGGFRIILVLVTSVDMVLTPVLMVSHWTCL